MRDVLHAFIVLLVAGVLLVDVAAAQDLDAARAQARQASEAYERGDFAEASEGYLRALDLGLDHALVHFDLGNAWFKQGEVGRAIASYTRASRMAPRDSRIATNLRRARADLRDRDLVAERGLPPLLAPITWIHGRLSLNEWWSLALLGWTGFVLSRIARHWWRVRWSWPSRVGLVLGGLALLAAAMGGVRYRSEVLHETAVVVAEEVEVRSGPGSGYNLAFRIHEGLTVRVAERREDWVRIDLGGELVGWVPADELLRI